MGRRLKGDDPDEHTLLTIEQAGPLIPPVPEPQEISTPSSDHTDPHAGGLRSEDDVEHLRNAGI